MSHNELKEEKPAAGGIWKSTLKAFSFVAQPDPNQGQITKCPLALNLKLNQLRAFQCWA